METAVNEKQALMIALAIISKEKDISDYGHSALHETKQVLQEMLDKKNMTNPPAVFKPLENPAIKQKAFKEMTIAEFEKQELAKLRGKEL